MTTRRSNPSAPLWTAVKTSAIPPSPMRSIEPVAAELLASLGRQRGRNRKPGSARWRPTGSDAAPRQLRGRSAGRHRCRRQTAVADRRDGGRVDGPCASGRPTLLPAHSRTTPQQQRRARHAAREHRRELAGRARNDVPVRRPRACPRREPPPPSSRRRRGRTTPPPSRPTSVLATAASSPSPVDARMPRPSDTASAVACRRRPQSPSQLRPIEGPSQQQREGDPEPRQPVCADRDQVDLSLRIERLHRDAHRRTGRRAPATATDGSRFWVTSTSSSTRMAQARLR